MLKAIKKFKAFITHEAQMQALFESFDYDKSGSLTADELLPLLKRVAEMEEVKCRTRYNATTERIQAVGVGQPDVDFVLSRFDSDKSGSISLEELGPALATWKVAAKDIPSTSCACVPL